LDLKDGHEAFRGPVVIGAAEPGFNPKKHLNRPGLLLSGALVYIAFGHGAVAVASSFSERLGVMQN
jgi:hypothetical protein